MKPWARNEAQVSSVMRCASAPAHHLPLPGNGFGNVAAAAVVVVVLLLLLFVVVVVVGGFVVVGVVVVVVATTTPATTTTRGARGHGAGQGEVVGVAVVLTSST